MQEIIFVKGQLISKQNCRGITSPKKRTQDFCPGRLLLQGQYKKRVYLLFATRQTLFCTNLEVVIFQGRNPMFIFLENPFHHKLLSRFTDLQYGARSHGLFSILIFSILLLGWVHLDFLQRKRKKPREIWVSEINLWLWSG